MTCPKTIELENYWKNIPKGTFVRVKDGFSGPIPDSDNNKGEEIHFEVYKDVILVFEEFKMLWSDDHVPIVAAPHPIYGSSFDDKFVGHWQVDELEVIPVDEL